MYNKEGFLKTLNNSLAFDVVQAIFKSDTYTNRVDDLYVRKSITNCIKSIIPNAMNVDLCPISFDVLLGEGEAVRIVFTGSEFSEVFSYKAG